MNEHLLHIYELWISQQPRSEPLVAPEPCGGFDRRVQSSETKNVASELKRLFLFQSDPNCQAKSTLEKVGYLFVSFVKKKHTHNKIQYMVIVR